MDLGLGGRVALVSGGSKGLGLAIAQEFAAEGARVIIASRGKEAIDKAVQGMISSGGQATGVSADMTTRDGVEKAVDSARQAYGDPEIVVNNVYGPQSGTFAEATAEDFQDAYRVMVMSQVWLVSAVVDSMKARRWGRIVTIGSTSAKEPHREFPLLTANVSRPAVVGLNKSLADELGPYAITVNTLATGPYETDRFRSYVARQAEAAGSTYEAFARERAAGVALGRLGDPREMAAVCAFVCSDRASFLTGQTLSVDGGRTRGLFG